MPFLFKLRVFDPWDDHIFFPLFVLGFQAKPSAPAFMGYVMLLHMCVVCVYCGYGCVYVVYGVVWGCEAGVVFPNLAELTLNGE